MDHNLIYHPMALEWKKSKCNVMSWEFKNNKNVIETSKKISSVYCQGIITD